MNITEEVAKKSNCFRRHIGAVIIKDDQIISTGYVGAPRGTKDCIDRGNCFRDEKDIPHGQRYELCRSVHAEQNAIINAARAGVSLLGGTMYIWGSTPNGELIDAFPCFVCKKMIINAGLEKVICMTKKGEPKVFEIFVWEREWRTKERDITDDAYQYGKPSE